MNTKKRSYVFDFDSTLTKVEALDVLPEITLTNNPNKNAIIQEIIRAQGVANPSAADCQAYTQLRIRR